MSKARRYLVRFLRPIKRVAVRLGAADPRFVIVTNGRTGSELLVSLLDSHPRIMCESEILAGQRSSPALFVLRRSAAAKLRGQAYGFKLPPAHARVQAPGNPEQFMRSFHDRGFRIILLERRDLVAQAISGVRARGGRYHSRRSDGTRFTRTGMDPIAVLASMYLFEQSAALVRSAVADVPVLRLVYEDDLLEESQHQRTIDRVCAHLGIPAAPVESDLVKVAPRSAAEQLENFDEIEAFISTTRFRKALPDKTQAP